MPEPYILVPITAHKRTVAEGRLLKLDSWLSRQKLSPEAMEAAEAFKTRLMEWADNPDAYAIAPSFHFCPGVC